MTPLGLQRITRIALFSALVYIFSWATSYLPNISLLFFIVFIAGYLWGRTTGMLIGAIGEAFWTFFNPYGPAPIPIILVQIIGASLSGLIGAYFRAYNIHTQALMPRILLLSIAGIICTLAFYLPVNLVDAWLFQPFVPRFIAGMSWSLIAIGSNMLIFPLLFNAISGFLQRELKRI